MSEHLDALARDLEIRGLSANTRKCYVRQARKALDYWKLPSDQITLDHVNDYQHFLTRQDISWSYFNQATAAVRFLCKVTLGKSWDFTRIPFHKTGRKLPVILSPEEVVRLFEAIGNLKHRAMAMTMYAGGLRVSEATHLRVTDIDSQRMVIRVVQGKGRKDRYVMLSTELLKILRDYWRAYRPSEWLFPGPDPQKPIARESVYKVIAKAAQVATPTKRVSPHSLRHACATHLLERGTNIRVIQTLLGHQSVRTTEIYTHVAGAYLTETRSPLDRLPRPVKPLPVVAQR